ncbi:hypothetical protein AAVH_42955, partial [Aphelenchoides avenae]
KELKADNYNLQHFLEGLEFDGDPTIGKAIILPATYPGSPRYWTNQFEDAMAIVRYYGRPDIFLTMTCNPSWPEVREVITVTLDDGEKFEEYSADRPDIIASIRHEERRVIGGDYRQTLPILEGAVKSELLDLSLKSCPLWKHFKANHFTLTENIRLNADQEELSRFQMSIGNGASNEGDEGFVLVTEVYSDLINGNVSAEALPEYLHGRCILAVLNSTCDEYNKRITHLLPGDLSTYKSTNKLIPDNATSELIDDMPMEVLESINPTGLPPHELNLKVGSAIIVMRNLDVRESLCNGTRLVVTRLGHRVIEAIHILGPFAARKCGFREFAYR